MGAPRNRGSGGASGLAGSSAAGTGAGAASGTGRGTGEVAQPAARSAATIIAPPGIDVSADIRATEAFEAAVEQMTLLAPHPDI